MSDFSNYFNDERDFSSDDDDMGGRIYKRRITTRSTKRKPRAKRVTKPRGTVNLRKIKSPVLRKIRKDRRITFSGGELQGGDFIGGEYIDTDYFGGRIRSRGRRSNYVGSKAPKRKLSKYNLFVKKMMPYMIKKFPRSSQTERMRKIGKLWRERKRNM